MSGKKITLTKQKNKKSSIKTCTVQKKAIILHCFCGKPQSQR